MLVKEMRKLTLDVIKETYEQLAPNDPSPQFDVCGYTEFVYIMKHCEDDSYIGIGYMIIPEREVKNTLLRPVYIIVHENKEYTLVDAHRTVSDQDDIHNKITDYVCISDDNNTDLIYVLHDLYMGAIREHDLFELARYLWEDLNQVYHKTPAKMYATGWVIGAFEKLFISVHGIDLDTFVPYGHHGPTFEGTTFFCECASYIKKYFHTISHFEYPEKYDCMIEGRCAFCPINWLSFRKKYGDGDMNLLCEGTETCDPQDILKLIPKEGRI